MGEVKKAKPAPAPVRQTLNDLHTSLSGMTAKAYPEVKTSGIKIRGTGAATKGTMARGPMA
jgi:hypothetical protein